ncbi:hypothetical protein CEUSTIGMA_g7883.t1 [Chlamydomonas eustigma]|uniref:Uncharacterized protein n=1 Tax=Chlamydomonas eustigma TaxID=1157962 RepID=A0A250XBJ9_9CHLO|nr:hypothetical protein CEUSTIGMA_g7883.t1 [Chlamydomonas eustigma]|eukprot:GAX80444.1 hypothetical protein CEUSTIGMA_g7883.t1 [Chlamydomonas eustigma]
MMANCEDEIIAWARRVGFSPKDASLSKSSITKLLKVSGARKLLEFAMKNFHSKSEVQAMREHMIASRQDQEALAEARSIRSLKTRLELVAKIEQHNASLKKARDMYMVRHQSQVEETVKGELRSLGENRMTQEVALQSHVLRAYCQRWQTVLQLMSSLVDRIDAFRSWIQSRSSHDVLGPHEKHELNAAMSKLVHHLEAAVVMHSSNKIPSHFPLQQHRTASPLQQQRTAFLISSRPNDGECYSRGGTTSAQDVEDALLSLSTCLRQCAAGSGLAALSEGARESRHNLPRVLASSRVAALGGAAADTNNEETSTPFIISPFQLLKRHETAHLARFVDAEEQRLSLLEARNSLTALLATNTSLQSCLQGCPLYRHQVQYCGLNARLGTLRSEVKRLVSHVAANGDVAQKVESLCQTVLLQSKQLDQLASLAPRLVAECESLVVDWSSAQHSQGFTVHGFLPGLCSSAAHKAGLAMGCPAGEANAWRLVPHHRAYFQLQQATDNNYHQDQPDQPRGHNQEGSVVPSAGSLQRQCPSGHYVAEQTGSLFIAGADDVDVLICEAELCTTSRTTNQLLATTSMVSHPTDNNVAVSFLCQGGLLQRLALAAPLVPHVVRPTTAASNSSGISSGTTSSSSSQATLATAAATSGLLSQLPQKSRDQQRGRLPSSASTNFYAAPLISNSSLKTSFMAATNTTTTHSIDNAIAHKSSTAHPHAVNEEAGMALVLRAAAECDALGPLRCPVQLALSISDHYEALNSMQKCWSDLTEGLKAPRQILNQLALRCTQIQDEILKLNDVDRNERIPQATCALDRLEELHTRQAGSVQRALRDWKDLPAIRLLPDVKVDGFSAGEWVDAIRLVHVDLRLIANDHGLT